MLKEVWVMFLFCVHYLNDLLWLRDKTVEREIFQGESYYIWKFGIEFSKQIIKFR